MPRLIRSVRLASALPHDVFKALLELDIRPDYSGQVLEILVTQ